MADKVWVFRSRDGWYYCGAGVGWGGYGGSCWVQAKEKALRLTREEAERVAKNRSGEIEVA